MAAPQIRVWETKAQRPALQGCAFAMGDHLKMLLAQYSKGVIMAPLCALNRPPETVSRVISLEKARFHATNLANKNLGSLGNDDCDTGV